MNEGPERIDYRETSDITEVHGAIKREHRDPSADVTPIPLWLSAVCAVAVCWAFAYLGVFHGGFSGNIYDEYESSPSVLFPAKGTGLGTEVVAAPLTLAQQGKAVFSLQCASCHQATGLGVAGQYPPLAKSSFVVGGEQRLVAILLKGIQGPLTVEGKIYNGAMPPWEALTDKKIAAVISYIRSEWGNSAGEVTEAKVAAGRKEFDAKKAQWTEADLLKIQADLNFGAAASAPVPAAPTTATTTVAPSAAGAEQMAMGKASYGLVCVACHQPNGLGLPPVFPPLVGSEYVSGDPKRMAAIVLKGVVGSITVAGKPFLGAMPAQEAALSDEKIAATLTYVRASFGNNYPPVSTDVVAAARKEFAGRTASWTEAELQAFGQPAGAVAPAQ